MATGIELNSYKVYCVTEGVDVYTYGYQETPPTVCPRNISHTIDTNTIEVVNTYTINSTFIEIDKTLTGGHMLTYGMTANFPKVEPGTVQNFTLESLPFTLRVMTLTINPGPENFLDSLCIHTAPYTTVGVLTQSAATGQNFIYVSPTAYSNIEIGFKVTLTGGGNTESFDHVISKNATGGTGGTGGTGATGTLYGLNLISNAVNSYPTGTYVSMSIPRILGLKINSEAPIIFSGKAPGTSVLPPGITALMTYTNNSGLPKNLNMIFDLFY